MPLTVLVTIACVAAYLLVMYAGARWSKYKRQHPDSNWLRDWIDQVMRSN